MIMIVACLILSLSLSFGAVSTRELGRSPSDNHYSLSKKQQLNYTICQRCIRMKNSSVAILPLGKINHVSLSFMVKVDILSIIWNRKKQERYTTPTVSRIKPGTVGLTWLMDMGMQYRDLKISFSPNPRVHDSLRSRGVIGNREAQVDKLGQVSTHTYTHMYTQKSMAKVVTVVPSRPMKDSQFGHFSQPAVLPNLLVSGPKAI